MTSKVPPLQVLPRTSDCVLCLTTHCATTTLLQMGCYLPRIQRQPWVRRLVEGSIKALSFFILQDPWANAYNPSFIPISRSPKRDRILGRGGWVWTRNFELDSSAYYFNLLYNYYVTPGLWGPEQLLNETLVHDAVVTMLQTLLLEQDHERSSPYRCVCVGVLWRGAQGREAGSQQGAGCSVRLHGGHSPSDRLGALHCHHTNRVRWTRPAECSNLLLLLLKCSECVSSKLTLQARLCR